MNTDARIALLSLAGEQHGLFTTAQGLEHGLGPDAVRNWSRSGAIRRVRRSVWMVLGSPVTPEQHTLATVLQAGHGAVAVDRTAAWLWKVPGHLPGEPRVLRCRDEHLSRVGRSRTSTLIEPDDVTIRRGIPVTTPVRTIFDLAGRQQPERTKRDLNHLMGRGLIRLQQLDHALTRLSRKGRGGITTMRALIAEVHEKGAPAGSNLELVVEDILEAVGFQHMERGSTSGSGDDESPSRWTATASTVASSTGPSISRRRHGWRPSAGRSFASSSRTCGGVGLR